MCDTSTRVLVGMWYRMSVFDGITPVLCYIPLAHRLFVCKGRSLEHHRTFSSLTHALCSMGRERCGTREDNFDSLRRMRHYVMRRHSIVGAGSDLQEEDGRNVRLNLRVFRYGVVANIIASHAIARGSIPRVGTQKFPSNFGLARLFC